MKYRCIPAYSSAIRTFDVCNRVLDTLTDSAGFLQSPFYPTYTMVPNECTIKIQAPSNKIIKLWIALDMKFSNYDDE